MLATVAERGAGFIAEAKTRSDVVLWEVTWTNREALSERVAAWAQAVLDSGSPQ